jgi:hypothetical protein
MENDSFKAQVDVEVADLEKRRSDLTKRRGALTLQSQLVLRVALICLLVPFFSFLFPEHSRRMLSAISLLYGAMILTMTRAYRSRLRIVEADIQDIEYQKDLRQFEVSKSESRAEKILRINELQLRRYYDLNLTQNLWVLWLGIICILLGIGVIVVSLYLCLYVAMTVQAQVVTAVLGGVGAILSNTVAAIYLKMNASASESLTSFHSKLVDTNRLLLANLLASRIDDDKSRWETLSSLAIGLVGSEPNKPQTK